MRCSNSWVCRLRMKRFGMKICKPIGTHMVTSHKLYRKYEIPTIEEKYISMIGGLQYLTQTIEDIANAVGTVARFQADPKEHIMQ